MTNFLRFLVVVYLECSETSRFLFIWKKIIFCLLSFFYRLKFYYSSSLPFTNVCCQDGSAQYSFCDYAFAFMIAGKFVKNLSLTVQFVCLIILGKLFFYRPPFTKRKQAHVPFLLAQRPWAYSSLIWYNKLKFPDGISIGSWILFRSFTEYSCNMLFSYEK